LKRVVAKNMGVYPPPEEEIQRKGYGKKAQNSRFTNVNLRGSRKIKNF
jgi:hypothetical protein